MAQMISVRGGGSTNWGSFHIIEHGKICKEKDYGPNSTLKYSELS